MNLKLQTVGRFIAVALIALVSSGCALYSASVDSIKRSGITESDRQHLLREQAKEFHNILFFGRVDAASEFIEDELKPTLVPQLTKTFKTDKFVEHTVDDVTFAEESRSATVLLSVKVFRNTDFLVKERTLTERWKFHTGGSWRLTSYEFTSRAR